jgi:coatomer subunit beta'
MDLAQESFEKANDLPALLLLYTSLSDREGMTRLATTALEKGANNIAFAAFLQLGDTSSCVNLLSKTGRLPEAALFARSYNAQEVPGVVKQWKKELQEGGKGKVAETIADPEEDKDLFPAMEASGSGSGSGPASNGSGSGVMVENEGESQQGYDMKTASTTTAAKHSDNDVEMTPAQPEPESETPTENEKPKTTEKVKEKVEHAVDKVEHLVDKVKDLAVGGGGDGE